MKTSLTCLSSFNWNYQKNISCLLKAIDPLSNTKFEFHASCPILISYSRIPKNIRRIVGIVRPTPFSNLSKNDDFQYAYIAKNNLFQKYLVFFLVILKVPWCPQNQTELAFGVMVTSTRSENHEHDGLSGSPKMKSKSFQSKMKQNNSTELLGHSFNTIYSKNASPQTPWTPNPQLFLDFPRFSIGLTTFPILPNELNTPKSSRRAQHSVSGPF